MQNQPTAQNPRPKLTIKYFAKIALEQLKGKIPVVILVLALLALPAAVINAYSSGNLLSVVSQLISRYDLSTPEGAQGLISAFQDIETASSLADIALWFISQLLTCAVITAGAVFVYEAVNKDIPFNEVKTHMPVTLLKRSPWVLLISVFSSFLMSALIKYITYLALLLTAFIGGLPGLIFSALVFFVILCLTAAFINLFIINMRTAVAVNRARLLFSVTYVSTILKGRYKKSLPVYIIALACRFFLTVLLTIGAYFILPFEGGTGYITLFVYYFLSLMIDGLFSAFYAINFFKLEITGQKQLIKLQAALMKKYEEVLRQSGQIPPSGSFTSPFRPPRSETEQSDNKNADNEDQNKTDNNDNSKEQDPVKDISSPSQTYSSPNSTQAEEKDIPYYENLPKDADDQSKRHSEEENTSAILNEQSEHSSNEEKKQSDNS